MFLDGKDFKTIWQLAHDWVDADPEKTDINAVSSELKDAIHRLMLASFNEEISIRTKDYVIFDKGYYLNTIFDYFHFRKFKQCLKQDKFDQVYLDSLYVKRNEVLDWCANIIYLDPPPCWALVNASEKPLTHNENCNLQTEKDRMNELQQRNAAYKRHEPIDNLKKECIQYWLQHQNYSNNQVARKFYESLPTDNQKLLASSNAVNTLSKAISEYKNREKLLAEDRLPRWLTNFNPENPQM